MLVNDFQCFYSLFMWHFHLVEYDFFFNLNQTEMKRWFIDHFDYAAWNEQLHLFYMNMRACCWIDKPRVNSVDQLGSAR